MEEGVGKKEVPELSVIRPGESFYPFARKDIKFSSPPMGHQFQEAVFPSVTLLFKFLDRQIPMEIYLEPGGLNQPKRAAIQPFAPRKGYLITNEDFVERQRATKLRKALNTSTRSREPGGLLRVAVRGRELSELGLAQKNPDKWNLVQHVFSDKETEQLFYSLYCDIEINDLRFRTEPNSRSPDASLWFGLFHPIDTPSMPSTEWEREGNDVFLPCDLHKLGELKMIFTSPTELSLSKS